jgi:hypothetical protein
MNRLDERLVREVFDAMLILNPSLEKYRTPDEHGRIDHREVAENVIKAFPLPVGIELRRLFSMGINRERIDQVLKLIERSMQFTAFILVTQLLDEVLKSALDIPHAFSKEFKRRFMMLAMGDFTWIIRSTGKIFKQCNITPFIPEMDIIFNNEFCRTLDSWVSERNDIGHHQINLTPEVIERKCVEYQENLIEFLVKLSFLVKCHLVTMRQIEVIKHKWENAKFKHTIDKLCGTGAHSCLPTQPMDSFTDSHSVLVLKDYQRPDEFLNLSPLIIDTRSEILDCREKFGIKKDLFLYSNYKNQKLHYVGTEVTVKCDLTPLENYGKLYTQFQEYINFIARGTTQ